MEYVIMDLKNPNKMDERDYKAMNNEQINHPQHYRGEDNPYEAIKVIEAWELGFCLGNTIKYISRAGKKEPEKLLQDLEKAKLNFVGCEIDKEYFDKSQKRYEDFISQTRLF
jgi:hypothetical protein